MNGEEGAQGAGAAEPAGEAVGSTEEQAGAVAGPAAGPAEELDLHETARLPWLESADDDDEDDGGVDMHRVTVVLLAGLALLVAIVGGIWWSTHRTTAGDRVADGSVIPAPAGPYKTAPANPGGKTYEGTGDSSYAVSQGKNPTAHLGGTEPSAAPATPAPARSAEPAPAKASPGAASAATHAATAAAAHGGGGGGGVGVQVGAYTSQASAEAGWAKLEKQYAPLAGVHHRIVQGQADIGTVYRLQAVTESDGAANALCATLKGAGLACQVRH
ncbi:MAG: SPOR domain-containing protein [Sphingomonadales bacterium]|nr:SPOR domain-containing protein [Sphingomonadales bacterium]